MITSLSALWWSRLTHVHLFSIVFPFQIQDHLYFIPKNPVNPGAPCSPVKYETSKLGKNAPK